MLNEDKIQKLAVKNQIKFSEEWQLLYIPGKLLSFTKGKEEDGKNGTYFKREHTWDFFDAAQFFYGSLEDASQEWLGKEKENEGLDIKQFKNESYRENNKDDIKKYCEVDAWLVKKLFNKFSNTAEELDLPAGWPISTGGFAEQFFRKGTE